MAPISWNTMMRRIQWDARQTVAVVYRRFGWPWFCAGVSVVLVFAMMPTLYSQTQRLIAMKQAHANSKDLRLEIPIPQSNLASDLVKFQRYLPEYEDVPQVLNDLIVLAGKNNLTLFRGEYQIQVDQRGNFLRNQMTLPVRGEAQAVERFILEALAQNKTLALEAVQFKREGGTVRDVEVKLQWVLLTSQPSNTSAKL